MKPSPFLLIIGLLACSCESKNGIMEKTAAPSGESPVHVEQVNQVTDNLPRNNIIKTADVKFQVNNVDESTATIQKIVSTQGAYLGSMNLESNETSISNHFVIRTPAAAFEGLLAELEKESVFLNYKKITAEDVTEEFIDLESRLQTKKEVKARYEDILRTKSKTVEDVLKAEDEIRTLEEEIEAKEGRLQYLQNKVTYSTINLEIYQKVDYKEIPDSFQKPYAMKAKEGFLSGWSVITNLALALITVWPLTLAGLVLFWKRAWIKQKFF